MGKIMVILIRVIEDSENNQWKDSNFFNDRQFPMWKFWIKVLNVKDLNSYLCVFFLYVLVNIPLRLSGNIFYEHL